MTQYTVALIDDEPDIIDDFLATAERVALNVEVIELIPDKETLVADIIRSNVDAVVIDYHLTDNRSDIKYDGAEVVSLLDKETFNFPKFIFTAFPSDAEDASNDINIVYEKGDDYTDFINRVIKQIEKHKKKFEEYELELNKLLLKSQTEILSIPEEEKIIELDSMIEKTLNKKNAIPISLKSTSTNDQLNKILSIASKLTEQLSSATHE